MKKLFLMLFAVGAFIAIVGYLLGPNGKKLQIPTNQTGTAVNGKIVKVGNVGIAVEIAESEDARRHGLSGRDSLPKDSGMLFVFPEKAKSAFWMKDMKFAIDIIWITDGKVVGIDKDARPEPGVADPNLKLYYAPQHVTHVLEVPSGYSDQKGLKVGDSVTLP